MKKSNFIFAALLGLYSSTSFMNAEVTPTEPMMDGDTYLISNYAELKWFGEYVNSATTLNSAPGNANARLTENITAPSDEDWYPMGTSAGVGYRGKFNGAGYSITGLNCQGTSVGNAGFFCYLRGGARVDSLSIIESTIGRDDANLAGGIVAYLMDATINQCSFSGTVIAKNNGTAGAICGTAYSSINSTFIEYCYANGSVNGSNVSSGIAGQLGMGNIKNCYSNAALSPSSLNKYGIAQKSDVSANIKDCFYSTSTINDAEATTNFKDGKVTYLLNGGAEGPFKQTIGTQEFPSFAGETVYQYLSCAFDESNIRLFKYTNDVNMKNSEQSHDLTHHAAVTATCQKAGNIAYWTCANEPGVFYKNEAATEKFASENDVVTTINHILVYYQEVAATCTKDGHKAYYQCANEPGVFYKDAAGKTKYANEEATIIKATGHDYIEHKVSAEICSSDNNNGLTYYTCKNDDSEFFDKDFNPMNNPEDGINAATGHKWEETWTFNGTDNEGNDIFVRHCTNNPNHTDYITHTHAWGKWTLKEWSPAKEVWGRICETQYGNHADQDSIKEFEVEDAIYYSQLTGSRDTLIRVDSAFVAVDTKNDLLFIKNGNTTITGANVIANDVCENLVITDKKEFKNPQDFTANTINYKRSSTDLEYQTFVLPYDAPTNSFNGYIYAFTGYDPSRYAAKFASIKEDKVYAGVPYILYRNENISGTPFKTVHDVEVPSNVKTDTIMYNGCLFYGSFTTNKIDVTKSDAKYYAFSANTFNLAKSTITEIPFRCIIELRKNTTTPRATLGLIFDENLTGVAEIDADGNLTIGNVDVYDMTGRLVRKNVESASCLQGLKKGIYVVNGEKFVKTTND